MNAHACNVFNFYFLAKKDVMEANFAPPVWCLLLPDPFFRCLPFLCFFKPPPRSCMIDFRFLAAGSCFLNGLSFEPPILFLTSCAVWFIDVLNDPPMAFPCAAEIFSFEIFRMVGWVSTGSWFILPGRAEGVSTPATVSVAGVDKVGTPSTSSLPLGDGARRYTRPSIANP